MNDIAIPVGTDGVRLVRTLPGPVDRVWTYLTDSQKRATWLAAGEFDLRMGGHVELRFDNDRLSPGVPPPPKHRDHVCAVTGTITRIEPLRALAFTWETDGAESEVAFELAPRGNDVELTITHRRIGERGARVGIMSGWVAHVGILTDRLNGVEPQPFWATHTRLEKSYDATL
jgi:uncharacterized protein YndB with AHSA1/START domain